MAAVVGPSAVGVLMRSIAEYSDQSLTRAALELSAMLFQRPGNICHMAWREIDLEGKLWTIPAAKMKRTVQGTLGGRFDDIIRGMTELISDSATSTATASVRKNPLSPKKLLLSKWTAVSPADKERHFVVTRVVVPDLPAMRTEWVEIEAVHSRRLSMLRWRDLTDGSRWRQGWL